MGLTILPELKSKMRQNQVLEANITTIKNGSNATFIQTIQLNSIILSSFEIVETIHFEKGTELGCGLVESGKLHVYPIPHLVEFPNYLVI